MGLNLTAKVIAFVNGSKPSKELVVGKSYQGYCANFLNSNSHIEMCGKRLKIEEVDPCAGFFVVKTPEMNLQVKIHSY